MLFNPGPVVDDNPNDNRAPLVITVSSVMMVLSFCGVGLRLLSRRLLKAPLCLDDWLILASLPFAWIVSLCLIWGCLYNKFGLHIKQSTLDSLHSFFLDLYVFEITYNMTLGLVKYSILALYWRIFNVGKFKAFLWVAVALNTCWLIAVMFAAIFSCNPIRGFWDFEIESKCIDALVYYWAQSICNIVIDVYILFLPLFMIVRLSISRSQKVAVSGIFAIGIFVTLCSAIRLSQLLISQSTADFTWNLVGSGLWTAIESNIAVLCACLPCMRPLLRLALHGTAQPRDRSIRLSSSHGMSADDEQHLRDKVDHDPEDSYSRAKSPVQRPEPARVGGGEKNRASLHRSSYQVVISAENAKQPKRSMDIIRSRAATPQPHQQRPTNQPIGMIGVDYHLKWEERSPPPRMPPPLPKK